MYTAPNPEHHLPTLGFLQLLHRPAPHSLPTEGALHPVFILCLPIPSSNVQSFEQLYHPQQAGVPGNRISVCAFGSPYCLLPRTRQGPHYHIRLGSPGEYQLSLLLRMSQGAHSPYDGWAYSPQPCPGHSPIGSQTWPFWQQPE